MAYSKKTWKARQGLGLNKFSIDGATPVAIVNQPDSVTQQGDALSAGNLNDLEDRIASAFDDVEESKADNSTIDDLQNQIVNLNTSVETLDAIVGGEAEIENIDPSEGQSILSSSRLIHHVNLLPSGEFGLVGARDIVHEGSIVNLNPTAFSVRGVQLWDEEWELGYINSSGEPASASNQIRSKNYTPVAPSSTYYMKIPRGSAFSLQPYVVFYDVSKLFIKRLESSDVSDLTSEGFAFITPTNCAYIKISPTSYYPSGATYNHDIQICDNSIPSAVKTVYHPYSEQTVPVSISGHYVNENVYDYVTNRMVNGVLRGEVHSRVKEIDLGDQTWTKASGYTALFYCMLSDIKSYSTSDVADILCDSYNVTAWSGADFTATWVESHGGYLQINDPSKSSLTADDFKSAMEGITLYYALATESVTYGEPLRSFSLTDYATIEPITPQTIPNRIDVPFSVLSKSNNGLIEQIAQNTADIADHKAILSQHEARLSNLEQISGEYASADMQNYSIVPTGKATYALVETMKGVSRVENQLVENGDFASTDGWTADSCSISASSNVLTATVTGLNSSIRRSVAYVNGHVNLVGFTIKSSFATKIRLYDGDTNILIQSISADTWVFLPCYFTASASSTLIRIYFDANVEHTSGTVQVKGMFSTDLTLYFNNGTIPTLAEIQSKYPELLEPRSYNAGEIVDATYSEVRSESKQIWDEQAEWGSYGGEVGEHYTKTEPYSTWNGIRCAEPIPVKPNTTYWVGFSTALNTYIQIQYLDSDGIIIGFASASVNGYSFTTPSNCVAVTMRTNSEYGSKTYRHDILLCYDSVTDKTYTPYWSPVTLAIPSVTLKGAGSVSDTLDVESGEITQPIASVDCDTLSWSYNSTRDWWSADYTSGVPINGAKKNCLYKVGINSNINGLMGDTELGYCMNDSNWSSSERIYIRNGSSVTPPDGYFYYELATPTTESVTPTLNNTLKTEGGGSVYTDAEVDGRFTLGFLNL